MRVAMGTFSHLEGCELEAVSHDSECHEWVFAFEGNITLRVSAPWRIAAGGEIHLGFEDDGQLFGLPAPLDAQERLGELAIGRRVDFVRAASRGDLVVDFDGDTSLEVFNASAGYEGWTLHGPGKRWIVGQGGGKIVESAEDA